MPGTGAVTRTLIHEMNNIIMGIRGCTGDMLTTGTQDSLEIAAATEIAAVWLRAAGAIFNEPRISLFPTPLSMIAESAVQTIRKVKPEVTPILHSIRDSFVTVDVKTAGEAVALLSLLPLRRNDPVELINDGNVIRIFRPADEYTLDTSRLAGSSFFSAEEGLRTITDKPDEFQFFLLAAYRNCVHNSIRLSFRIDQEKVETVFEF